MTPPLPDLAAERLDALLDAERENTALRAEVARLRVINADLRRMVDGLETAAHEERAAVVERLRAEVSYLRACVPPTRPTDYGHEVWTAALVEAKKDGARSEVAERVAEERAAVVAWLEKAGWMPSLVEVFRRGEHRREEET
jgi:inorganic triphosphatase YgiF